MNHVPLLFSVDHCDILIFFKILSNKSFHDLSGWFEFTGFFFSGKLMEIVSICCGPAGTGEKTTRWGKLRRFPPDSPEL